MTWEEVLLENASGGADLQRPLGRLFARAEAAWPLWRDGNRALRDVVHKTLPDGPDRVLVQTNPRRVRSVHAAVDAAAVAARPCFLCPDNFPPGECGIGWHDLALLPNPFPIISRHLTIPSREHRPQALAGRARDLVELARGVGGAMAVLYNGPRCGASAPDHFHFQACDATVPALDLLPRDPPLPGLLAVTSFGRRFAALTDGDPTRLAARIEAALAAWGRVLPDHGEPMCNVLVNWRDGHGTALFFPRRAHRPAAFHATGDSWIGVSPAALEMSGILVVTDTDSFERLDAAAARTVYQDVSPTPPQFAAFMEEIQ